MKTAAILVLYTEAFADTAVQVFARMVRRVDAGCRVIIVSNNPWIKLEAAGGVTLLQGDNKLHEFGAWQIGLDHLRSEAAMASLDLVWFANDTFCHYRSMGAMEQAAFVRSARAVARAGGAEACGELALSPWRKRYNFDGVEMDRWIATYLFALNRHALDAIGWCLRPQLEQVERWAPCGPSEAEFFAPEMAPLISKHFCNWLFGPPGKMRWRRAAPLSPANHALMQGKAHALVCEQILSAELVRGHTRLRSVFHTLPMRVLRKLLARA